MKNTRQHLNKFVEENGIVSLVDQLFDTIPGVYFYIKDRQSNGVWSNKAFHDSFGLSDQEELNSKYIKDLSTRFKEFEDPVLNDGIAVKNKIHLITTMKGIVRWHVTSVVPLYGHKGVIKGLAGITRELKDDKNIVWHHPVLGKVMQYINDHYSEQITTTEMAKIARLSISALERNFKKNFFMTPTQYLNNFRVSQACKDLLMNKDSITCIAEKCGFYDQSHFSRTFKKMFDFTPAAYRKHYI